MRPLKVRRILFVFYFIFFFFQAEDGIRDYKVTGVQTDRKSTRLNSSHLVISYAVFLLGSEEHTSELQSPCNLVCRLLLEKKKQNPARLASRILRKTCNRPR